MKTLSQEALKEWLSYDLETGIFRWLKKPNRRIVIGSIAGSAIKTGRHKGRTFIHVESCGYGAHRLAWLYVHGSFPKLFIDHINGDPGDNRISNLREVTAMGNSQNVRRQRSGSTSGLLGAAKGRRGKWESTIKVNKKKRYLGEFKTPQEAHEAYVAAKRKYHPTCTI